jgi:phosphoribosylformylglycinamidine synthase
VEDAEKMAALVRTCAGLQEACLQLSAPLISGKDSMKNDYKSELKGQKVKISVLPTLLMTALGRIENYKNARTADFKNPGDVIYILGPQDRGLLESEWHCLQKIHVTTTGKGATNSQTLSVGQAHWDQALPLYNWLGDEKNSSKILSAHDVSDGGILVSIAESCFTKNLGVNFESSLPLQQSNFSFGEGLHQIIVSCAASHNLALEKEWSDKKIAFQKLDAVTDSGFLQWQNSVVATEDLYAAWSGDSL